MNMILTLKRKTKKILFSLFILTLFLPSTVINAQEALTLSISPSLFDISIEPNQEWRSSLRVINVNDYDLTVYVDVVNFLPQGEGGSGRFVPIDTTADELGTTLAEWFIIDKEAIVIPREQSREVPINVRVPDKATPGGHFAAILVGTKPLNPEEGEARVQTSQMVTSLFFARVAGDIREVGLVREFSTVGTFLAEPEATFELRFENKGNVHLQPQGEIKIKNMWGQERGIIPINQSTQFGNVLPQSIRKFTFAWKGEWSFSDIGRYTAEVTLAYGTEARQFATGITNFWVIPYKLLFGILLILSLFIFATTWLVRLYVRRMLSLAGIDFNEHKNSSTVSALSYAKRKKIVSVRRPVAVGFNDFKSSVLIEQGLKSRLLATGSFLVKYRLFFVALVIFGLFIGLVVWYVSGAVTDTRGYEIEYVNSDANLRLTSEEIIYRQLKRERETVITSVDESLPHLKVVNRSGIPGLGAEAKLTLEENGYQVDILESDFTTRGDRTVIVYSNNQEREALRLSARLNNAPISTYEAPRPDEVITVYVGDDIRAK